MVDEIMSVFIMAFNTLIQQEIELSQRVSEEEWEEIRPSRIDRRQSMILFIKVKLVKFKISSIVNYLTVQWCHSNMHIDYCAHFPNLVKKNYQN